MRNTLTLIDGKYTLNSLGPWPRTEMQVAFGNALWAMPDRRFVHEPAALPANVLDMVSTTR